MDNETNKNVYLMAIILSFVILFHLIDPVVFIEKLGYVTIAILSLCEVLERTKKVLSFGWKNNECSD